MFAFRDATRRIVSFEQQPRYALFLRRSIRWKCPNWSRVSIYVVGNSPFARRYRDWYDRCFLYRAMEANENKSSARTAEDQPMTTATTKHEHAVAELPAPIQFTPRGIGRHEFMATLLPGIYERKVLNLVLDQKADLKKCDENVVELRFGRQSVVPEGVAPIPVDATITLQRYTKCPNPMTHVVLELRPRGQVVQEKFAERCNHIVRAVQACLIGHELRRLG